MLREIKSLLEAFKKYFQITSTGVRYALFFNKKMSLREEVKLKKVKWQSKYFLLKSPKKWKFHTWNFQENTTSLNKPIPVSRHEFTMIKKLQGVEKIPWQVVIDKQVSVFAGLGSPSLEPTIPLG
ncbi:hypothetical protein ACH5RR_028269 [Cinchona calisaya]|uniref:Uncharacterized protein n=1 Tax=Cinchona calisaya TaxID=153742 RepID=A0ABD2YPI0_9GENT